MKFVGWVIVLAVLLAAMGLGSSSLSFFDAPSFFLVTGISLGALLARYPLKDIVVALRAIGSVPSSQEERTRALTVLSTLRVAIMGSGVTGFLIGFVLMLQNMDDPSAIGPAMAVALLCALYSVVLSEIVVAPSLTPLRDDAESKGQSGTPVTFSMVPMLVYIFGGVGLMFFLMVAMAVYPSS